MGIADFGEETLFSLPSTLQSFIHETVKAPIDDENEVIKISFILNPI